MPRTIDLNADVGEGVPGDVRLLEVVTSANVACGFHAGDEVTMRALCRVAAARGVAVGAHVGYRDREGFGRRPLDVPPEAVVREAVEQIAALQRCAAAEQARVTYVKPHGALYARATTDRACANAIVAAARAGELAAVLGPPGSELLAAAEAAGLRAVPEGFADRGYLPNASLVPRGDPGALQGEDAAVHQAILIAREHAVVATDGSRLPVHAESICIHGDSPAAEAVARHIAHELRAAGIELAPFA